ncbi:MAG: zinc finger-like domain-containing protein [Muribaculaceae bacterium]|nr:zinc finger-like domain-containing protein [Muribaculaceae bacterium]
MKRYLYSLIMMLMCAALFVSCDKDEPSQEITDYESFYATGRSDGYEYIDIGLSVPWATCNYGAFSPYQFGDYTLPVYWGKSTKIPSQISGSDWDRLRHLMGKNWRLPTETEAMELKNLCSWSRCIFNGTEGVKVTGPNGKSIFFPITGWNYFDEIPWSNIDGPYLQYSENFWGFLESDGKFDLLIPYENTYLRYAMNNDGELYFQITTVNSISPLRAVYSSSNPSDNSSSGSGGNSGGGSSNHHYPCKSCNESGKCWNCNGKGVNPITNKTCNTCHGTGKCQTCNGRGYIII